MMMIFNKLENKKKLIESMVYRLSMAVFMSLFSLSVAAEASEINFVKSDKVSIESAASLPGDLAVKWELYAEQWELARRGDSILSLPPLNKLINHWLEDKSKKIEIQYPGGEEGEVWVQELSDWLVSLAIPSDQMFFLVGSGADDMIKLQLVKSEILIY